MWARNIFFAGVCVAGLALVAGSLFPDSSKATHLADSSSRRLGIEPTAEQIDQLLAKRWTEYEVAPVDRAETLQIARRISLALTGTIPSVEEIRWLESIPEGDRLDQWISRIFADRRYADYLAERLARVYVGTDDGPFLLYRRRRFVSWLADELHANRPYDQIVKAVVADAGLWTDTPSTNFVTANIKPDSDEDPDPVRLAGRVARAFLGVRIDCAECHDHPFDEWKQKDFQALAAYFAQTKRSFTGIADRDGELEAEDHATGKRRVVAPAVPFQPELLPATGSRREQLAGWITHPDNRAFARAVANRAWALMYGRAYVEPVDNLPPADGEPGVIEVLADDFVAHQYDLQRLLTVIASTRAYQLDSRAAADSDVTEIQSEHWAAFPMTRLRPEQVVGGLLQSASLTTIDYQSHILTRIGRQISQGEFVKRYGDMGSDEFDSRGGTIPQRLLLMNGELVKDKTKESLVANAATRIAALAPSDEKAIEVAMLAVLSRRPTAEELVHFRSQFAATKDKPRDDRMEDLYWTLLNTTEFSWNH